MKVKSVLVNWFATQEGEEYTNIKIGDRWKAKTGTKAVVEILYHYPMGEGDKHYIDVKFDDGSMSREFNINSIDFVGD